MGRNDAETYYRHRKPDSYNRKKHNYKGKDTYCSCAREGCKGWRETKKMLEDEGIRCNRCFDLFPADYIPGPLKAKWATLHEQDKKKAGNPIPKDDVANKPPSPEDAAAAAADKDKYAKLKEELEKIKALADR